MEAVTQAFAKQVGSRGITINAVAPGPVDTPLFTRGKAAESIDRIADATPFGRLGQPEGYRAGCRVPREPRRQMVNGQVLRANGGLV